MYFGICSFDKKSLITSINFLSQLNHQRLITFDTQPTTKILSISQFFSNKKYSDLFNNNPTSVYVLSFKITVNYCVISKIICNFQQK